MRTVLFLTMIIFFSCDNSKESKKEMPHEKVVEGTAHVANLEKDPRNIGGEKSEEQKAIEQANKKLREEKEETIAGYWVGDFGKNKINLALYKVEDDSVFGYSICAGNFRPLRGAIEKENELTYDIRLVEPGDDPYDGEFMVTLDKANDEVTGNWEPFKKEGNTAKSFKLERRSYEYKTDVGEFPQASQRYLKEEDVENLPEFDLVLMRNEIYARHGYSFKNKDMRYLFNKKDWYIPMGVDIRDQLTEIEAVNIDLIYRYESYYEEYYDEFGR